MTIQEFIEAAIEGGWGGNWKKKPIIEILENKCVGFHYAGSFDGIQMSIYDIFLQPKAWQAVGKVKGWDHSYHNYELRRNIETEESLMLDMIHALNTGSTLEEYIATLE